MTSEAWLYIGKMTKMKAKVLDLRLLYSNEQPRLQFRKYSELFLSIFDENDIIYSTKNVDFNLKFNDYQ